MNARVYLGILLSLVMALFFMLVPFLINWEWLRPNWIALVIIYWVAFLPGAIGLFTAFIFGLLLDCLSSILLGKTALALTVVAFFTMLLREKLRLFQIWQQTIVILVLVGFYQLILMWVQMAVGYPPLTFFYWSSAFVSAALWPFILTLLRRYHSLLQVI